MVLVTVIQRVLAKVNTWVPLSIAEMAHTDTRFAFSRGLELEADCNSRSNVRLELGLRSHANEEESNGSILFIDGPDNHFLRTHSSHALPKTSSMSLSDVGAAISVLLGFNPPASLSADSSSKLNEVLSPNPFNRPRAVLMLEVGGTQDQQLVMDHLSNAQVGSAIRSKVLFESTKAEIHLPGKDEVSVISLDEYLGLECDAVCIDKELQNLASWFGGSYVSDAQDPLNGELTVTLASGTSLNLHMSKETDREFIVTVVSLIRNIRRATEMHVDSSRSIHSPAELMIGSFSGLKALREKHGLDGFSEQKMELFVTTLTKLFHSLQEAYKGQIVGVLLFNEKPDVELGSKLNVKITSQPSIRLLGESLAANLGVSTGRHLSELCKEEYPKYVNYCLWLLAEVAVIAADIPEVIGTAFALNILFGIQVWVGVLLTGLSTLLLLGVQRYGIRKLEILIALFVFVMAGCFFAELSYVKPPVTGVLQGMFIPKLNGDGATGDAIALFGALIMPHNLFLHSALVLSRKIPKSVNGINSACRYFLIESGFALVIAFFINVAVISVSGTVCSEKNLSHDDKDRCKDITLNSASFLLQNVLKKSSANIYAIALLASGQSSAITGTYAGQYIMQGFLNLKMKMWIRNLMTRCIAIAPSLIVSIIGGSSGAGQLIIIASIIAFSWILGLCLIATNIYFLASAFIDWLIHNKLPKVANVFIGIIVFPMMAIYVISVIYLAVRKDKVVTFIDATKPDHFAQIQIEKGINPADDTHISDDLPYREDLAEMTHQNK
ncbi:hypothetical protein IFM89_024898 [Coptis chinensis]|uniref:DUF7794 domain-containing protein n=1 Tax=Coptis chinensis TaxID=261450 RepID=A0A835I5G1_9MAGN|nr:hypothetical protein IFM89_024898 [Coptis chinensis]